MADLVGVIWRSPRGEREHIVRVSEITSADDRRHRQVRYTGYSPADKRKVQLLAEDHRQCPTASTASTPSSKR